MKIGFNKPYLTGREKEYISQAVSNLHLSGNGEFTKKCHTFFQENYGFGKCLLTNSCTAALEMAALLIDIQAGDEVIMPSYTFVSTANAFVLRGAKILFCDSYATHPNIDHRLIEGLITHRTRAIVVVHYAGVACEMDAIMALAEKYKLYVVEDAAQAIDSYYKGRPLGSIGHFAAFSFHETKNISSGEGGMLVVNDSRFFKRSEVIWEKGTNRAAFWRGEVDKYNWIDIGSSFLPSDIIAAFLFAQLEHLERIQGKRMRLWNEYFSLFTPLKKSGVLLPHVPESATPNGHIFYIVCRDLVEQTRLIEVLKKDQIVAVFHYQSLHRSPFYQTTHGDRVLENADKFSNCLVRLPLYYELSEVEQQAIYRYIMSFFFETSDVEDGNKKQLSQ